jgi:hypothetical protein
MIPLLLGISILLFGLVVGGVGIATAGVGIGIPMIPLGIYTTYRGFRIYKHEREVARPESEAKEKLEPLEKTKLGKFGVGVLLVLVGGGTASIIIGIPILLVGIWFIYMAYKTPR